MARLSDFDDLDSVLSDENIKISLNMQSIHAMVIENHKRFCEEEKVLVPSSDALLRTFSL